MKRSIRGFETEKLTELRVYDGSYAITCYFSDDGFRTCSAGGIDTKASEMIAAFAQLCWETAFEAGRRSEQDNR